MVDLLRKAIKLLPSLILSFLVALAVWISAVISSDPTVTKSFPNTIPIEIIGQNPGLVMTHNVQSQISLTLKAPQSIWEQLTNGSVPIQAIVDLSGLGKGDHNLPVQVQIGIRPVELVSYTPPNVSISLEPLITRTMPIHLVRQGDLAIGFQSQDPVLSQDTVTVSGPESSMNRVQDIQAILDINQAHDTITRAINLLAVDSSSVPVTGVTIIPDRITVDQVITQRGGYRNVVVKVIATDKVATGYRLTNISVVPSAVTVFSTDPNLVNDLPGYVETVSLSLNGAKDDFDLRLPLNLPKGVSVVGDQTVLVQVGVAAIESSLTLTNMKVEIIGLGPGLYGYTSPETVDVILAGPLPVLDTLKTESLRVVIDVTGQDVGTYQYNPKVELTMPMLRVESILPETVEVIITNTPTVTPTPPKK